MTDFVLEVSKELHSHTENYDRNEMLHKIINYAEFLKQPLTLWMFVPTKLVNVEWIILEEPDLTCKRPESKGNCQCGEESIKDCREWWNEYQVAKQRVFFESFELIRTIYSDTVSNGIINYDLKQCKELKITIDCLVNDDLVLTESAKKQIGL